ncbi:glycine-rich extracellular protein 1 isoform X1 [Ranitomeya imitator]|uniref:glycine-rich extracellular protein 1 isoform X1 n=1 Tax=Ranitomeya imitator TaxID=111125 RepID=UPI0037E7121A
MLLVALILCFVGCSFQGGLKPQASGAASPIYQPEYVRGAGSQQLGPLGSKAGGKYSQYPSQGFQQGSAGIQNGYGGLGQKSGRLGLGQFPSKQKPGYGNYPGNVLAQGIGAQPSKAGYGAGGYPNIGGYRNGAAGYPSNIAQQGYGGKPPKSGFGAGNYPQIGAQTGYGAGNYPQYGEQAGYGAGNYPQFGAQAGYNNGAGRYPSNLQQQGYGTKSSKAGYGAGNYLNAAQGGYRNGYGAYPSNLQQQGKSQKAGYGNSAGLQGGIGKPSKAGAGFPNSFFPQGLGSKPAKTGLYQQPYPNGLSNYQSNGKGIKSPLSAYQGPVGERSKLGSFGKLPYRSQPLAADSLGYDAKSGVKSPYGSQAAYPDPASSKYAGAGQIPYSSQPVSPSVIEEDVTPSSPVEGGYQQLGGGQGPWTYAPEESSYTQNGQYGNGYRGCSGKC